MTRPGGGGRFCVHRAGGAPPGASGARGAARSPRVLVVDDSEGVRSYLASLLELRGFAVDTAGDGRSALALLDAGAAPDVVLLDVMMPGLDGLETLRRMRERAARRCRS